VAGAFTEKYKELQSAPEDVWVESGTYHGHGVLNALRYGFKELHTIEVSPARFAELYYRNPELCRDPRIHRYLGSSRDLLRPIIEKLTDRNVVFWLDGHYQGESKEERDAVSECPILAELQAIADQPWKRSVLVCIDDWNLFTDNWWENGTGQEKFTESDWPRESQLAEIMQGWRTHCEDHILYFQRDFA